MSDTENLRLLRLRDLPSAFELSAQAGWNQTEDDWRMLLELAPEGCWGIEIDGVLAATTTLICYGRRLAWVGMVLTRAEFQRRGLAKRLFEKALEYADEIGIETVKLDATEQGRPLYEKFGFRREREIQRWTRDGKGALNLSVSTSSGEVFGDSDCQHFGADRPDLLAGLARKGFVLTASKSYLLARAGRKNAYLGPCVAENPEIARELITRCVDNTSCGWAWDLFPENRNAVAIAQQLGFVPRRFLTRMSRGKELQEDVNAIYAIAGFEIG